jgi:hypothetical protein
MRLTLSRATLLETFWNLHSPEHIDRHLRNTGLFHPLWRSNFPEPVADQGEAGPDAVALRGGASEVMQQNGKTTQWMAFYVGTAKQHTDWSSGDFLSKMPK